MTVEDVGCPAPVLRIADSDSPLGEMRYFHAAGGTACAAAGIAAAGAWAVTGDDAPGADARNAITALRSFSVFSPGNGILLPGTHFCGSVKYASSVATSQVRLLLFIAGE